MNEGTFADLLADEHPSAIEDADLTQIFAGLEAAEPAATVWRRGDDDLIGAGTTPSRSKGRSLRLRRKAA